MKLIWYIDDQLGHLLGRVHEMGLTDDTLIFFTSDHGETMGEHWFSGQRIKF